LEYLTHYGTYNEIIKFSDFISFIIFKDSLGLVNQIDGLVNESWASGKSFDSKMVVVRPS